MGQVHRMYIDPTSPEGIASVVEYLHSVFGSNAQVQVLHLASLQWGAKEVTDMHVATTIAGTSVRLRVLYRIVRAEPLELSVWFDDSKNHGNEISVPTIAAPIQDRPKAIPPLSFLRR